MVNYGYVTNQASENAHFVLLILIKECMPGIGKCQIRLLIIGSIKRMYTRHREMSISYYYQ